MDKSPLERINRKEKQLEGSLNRNGIILVLERKWYP